MSNKHSDKQKKANHVYNLKTDLGDTTQTKFQGLCSKDEQAVFTRKSAKTEEAGHFIEKVLNCTEQISSL